MHKVYGFLEWICKEELVKMTLIVGWLACDQRGPCSAYIASDSRISDNRNFYDYSQKTFALKNTPDILGYCGETLFTYVG